jgi:RimJ/RimL family protein N-acetyltransferase
MVMNLTFRQIEYTDLEFINNVRNQYANEYLHDSRTFDITGTKNWFLTTKPDYWMLLNEDNVIGYFRLSNYSSINKNIYIGADIAPEYVGKGFAKPSYILFMDFLFKTYNLHKINLEVLSTNTRAINLYTKLGFKKDGVKRQEVLKGEKFIDSIMMSILKEEYYGFILENK